MENIKTINDAQKYLTWLLFSFKGRLNRKPFWVFIISISLLSRLIGHLSNTAEIVFLMVVIWPVIAVLTKRWHDREKNGWWSLLIIFPPLLGLFWVVVEAGIAPGAGGTNKYGPNPLGISHSKDVQPTNYAAISFLFSIVSFLILIFFSIEIYKESTSAFKAIGDFAITLMTISSVSGMGVLIGIIGVTKKQIIWSALAILSNLATMILPLYIGDNLGK